MVNGYHHVHASKKKDAGTMYTPKLKDVQGETEEKRKPLTGALWGVMQDWSGKFCELTVWYLNGGLEGKDAQRFVVQLADALHLKHFDWYDGVLESTASQYNPSDNEGWLTLWKFKELRDMHRQFKGAVTWLCKPKPSGPRLFEKDDFGIKPLPYPGLFESERDPFMESNPAVDYFEKHGMVDFKLLPFVKDDCLYLVPRCSCLIDVFCYFLLNECAGKKPDELPVKICPSCGRFFSAFDLTGGARIRKQHCSNSCQQGGWWPKDKRADHAYVKRLWEFAESASKGKSGYTPADLRKRLNRPRDRQRLEKIKNRWSKDWPRIVERIAEIERLAQGEVKHGKA